MCSVVMFSTSRGINFGTATAKPYQICTTIKEQKKKKNARYQMDANPGYQY